MKLKILFWEAFTMIEIFVLISILKKQLIAYFFQVSDLEFNFMKKNNCTTSSRPLELHVYKRCICMAIGLGALHKLFMVKTKRLVRKARKALIFIETLFINPFAMK